MHKAVKRLLAVTIAAALICGGVYGGLTFYKKSQAKPVAVYPVADIVIPSEYYMEDSQAYGTVSADRIQSVFLSQTQNVTEVMVSEGQEVKRGDPLLKYDTTLTSIQLEKAEIALKQQELALKRAKEELEKIKRLVPYSDTEEIGGEEIAEPEVTPTPTPKPVHYDPQETGGRVKGEGTRENPYIYLWSTSDALTNDQLLAMFTESGEIVHTDDPAEVTASLPDSFVETAEEARIWNRFGLMPLNVWGDENVEEGFEVTEDFSAVTDPDSGGNVEEAVEVTEETEYPEFSENPEMDATPDFDGDPSYEPSGEEDPGENTDVESAEEYDPDDEYEEDDVFADGTPIEIVTDESSGTDSTSAQTKADYSWLDGAPNEVYVILEMHENDNIEAPVLLRYGLHLIRDGANVAVRLFNPDSGSSNSNTEEDLPEIDDEDVDDDDDDVFFGGGFNDVDDDLDDEDDEDDEDDTVPSLNGPSIDFSAHYTAKEIEEMRVEKEKEVRDETIEFKIDEINFKEMQQEMADGVVRSKINGVIKKVTDPADAFNNSEAAIVVSGGGGYLVNISVSELELDSLAIDQAVAISSFDNDSIEYMGYVGSLSDYPSGSMDGWSMGNPNVSYYPCTINASEDAEFREGDYVSVKYNNNNGLGNNSFFVEKMYVRSDSSGRYVYVKNADGKLEKRYIVTGKSPDGYVIEVRGGLSQDDYIAFPYGSSVEEGAVADISSIEDLYAG